MSYRSRLKGLRVGLCAALVLPSAMTPAAESPFLDAAALWHFAPSEGSPPPPDGVRMAVPLDGGERAASLARGGDGFAAAFSGAGGIPVARAIPHSADAMTWAVRVKAAKGGGILRTPAFSLLIHPSGIAVVLLGVEDAGGLMLREIPLQPLAFGSWHDLLLRYARTAATPPAGTLDFIVDGAVLIRVPVAGALREVFPEPALLGGWTMAWPGEPEIPAHATRWLYERPLTGALDHVALWTRALGDAEAAQLCGVEELSGPPGESAAARCLSAYRDFHDASRRKDVAACERLGAAMRRHMARDPRRPVYHLTAPMDTLFDPAGAFYHGGRYHLFSYRGMVSILACTPLAHYVSDDLVRWRDQPIAIWADHPVDVKGIWLANLFLDDAGVPAMTYTALGERGKYGALARSTDGLVSFGEKRRVMDSFYHHDGHTWKGRGEWLSITVRQYWGRRDRGDAIHLLRSADLKSWTDRGEIFAAPKVPGSADFNQARGVAEFPYLLPFGGKHVLMVGTKPAKYWIGTFDAATPAFGPDDPTGALLDYGNPFHCFNPSIVDAKGAGGSPRRVILAMHTVPSGSVEGVPWAGVHVLPRVLSFDGSRLNQEPVPELESLRRRPRGFGPLKIAENTRGTLAGLSGDVLELDARFTPGTATRFGLKVRLSKDGKSFARIFFDAATGEFGADGTLKRTSSLPEIGRGPSHLPPGAPVRMRIFLDRSLIEVFVNGQAFTGVLAAELSALDCDVFSEGGDTRLDSLEAWDMEPAFSP
jgi:sucrose-6-phosphate hydrolase SacC (GH32 family)